MTLTDAQLDEIRDVVQRHVGGQVGGTEWPTIVVAIRTDLRKVLSATVPPLVKGTSYNTRTHGWSEYLGIDRLYGQCSHEFRTKYGRHYVSDANLAAFLTPPG